jgi:CheY-like chemotaxis protein
MTSPLIARARPADLPLERGDAARRVLVADDDEEMRLLMRAVLRRRGADIVEATCGEDLIARALDVVDAGMRLDLIISDVQMPGMTGLDALDAIRARVPIVPVIMITAYPSAEVRGRAEALGAIALLPKPFPLDVLEERVRSALAIEAPASGVR